MKITSLGAIVDDVAVVDPEQSRPKLVSLTGWTILFHTLSPAECRRKDALSFSWSECKARQGVFAVAGAVKGPLCCCCCCMCGLLCR